jgi:hypothetical protein
MLTATMTVPVRAYIYMPTTMRGFWPVGVCADVYEVDDDLTQAKPIATDGTVQHHTFGAEDDNDWIAFVVTDDSVDYVIETFDLLGGADTVIYLVDSDGVTLLDWNDDAGPEILESYLAFDPAHPGTYYVNIDNYDPAVAGCAVGYSVRVTAQP